MEEWLKENLSQLLNFNVPPDLIQYIIQIQDERDLDEYLQTLLNYNDQKHRQFIANLKKRRSGTRKVNDEEVYQKQTDKKKGKGAKSKDKVEIQKVDKDKGKTEKKKTKFVNLYSEDGKNKEILLKGRHKCDCEARSHRLINNCLSCGRIVCMQEGAGPCFFCGELVCSPEQQQILSSNTKQADSLYNKLMERKPNKDEEESLRRRDILLEYDRNCEQRTKVIDDESDYFQSSSNTWLSKEEREMMKKKEDEMMAKKHESRLNRKITFDFAGRKIIDEDNCVGSFEEDNQIVNRMSEEREFKYPDTELLHRPSYISIKPTENVQNKMHPSQLKMRIQDKEYLEMSDNGMCLSMHQPYATLLVAGIKEHEGRTWYTSHRGRLWIASTTKIPNPNEIMAVEHQYRVLKDENIQFPQNYPTGCLLGCVTVVDVLTQEEYRKKYPNGESESPYVYICEDFYELPIRFPIKGKHKIYKLDDKIHRAAQNSLEKMMLSKAN